MRMDTGNTCEPTAVIKEPSFRQISSDAVPEPLSLRLNYAEFPSAGFLNVQVVMNKVSSLQG